MSAQPEQWRSQTAFIFATAAAAVGLGNIWRFPYLAGENGGAVFVLIYLFFVVVLGIPLMTSEVVLGRIGKLNPAGSIRRVALEVNRSRHWGLIGNLTVLASFLILTYYMVIAGWVLEYFVRTVLGHFHHINESFARTEFTEMLGNPWQMLASDTAIVAASAVVLSLGIKRGLERTVMFLFPALIVLMILLLIYSITAAEFKQGVIFLFDPDLSEVTPKVVLMALGQAFFSLNIAMGIIIVFSAYLPKKINLMQSILAVVFFDTAIAILSGLIIFPIVFAHHLQPAAGPSLIFRTLPIAFSHMPYGHLTGSLFFLLLLFAAFTSAISLLEVTIAWLVENFHMHRKRAVYLSSFVCWLISLGTIASFSNKETFSIHGVTFYAAIDFITSGIMLPLGGLLIAFFTGWMLPKQYIHAKIGWKTESGWFKLWRWMKRYFAPIAIALILLTSFGIL